MASSLSLLLLGASSFCPPPIGKKPFRPCFRPPLRKVATNITIASRLKFFNHSTVVKKIYSCRCTPNGSETSSLDCGGLRGKENKEKENEEIDENDAGEIGGTEKIINDAQLALSTLPTVWTEKGLVVQAHGCFARWIIQRMMEKLRSGFFTLNLKKPYPGHHRYEVCSSSTLDGKDTWKNAVLENLLWKIWASMLETEMELLFLAVLILPLCLARLTFFTVGAVFDATFANVPRDIICNICMKWFGKHDIGQHFYPKPPKQPRPKKPELEDIIEAEFTVVQESEIDIFSNDDEEDDEEEEE